MLDKYARMWYNIITKDKKKEKAKMTNAEYKEMLKRKLEELQKQGKNPHGLMRDLLVDLELDEFSE